MCDSRDPVELFLTELESSTEPVSEAAVADRVRAFRRANSERADDPRLIATTVGFSLSAGPDNDSSGLLGSRFHPMMTWKDNGGVEYAFPDVSDLTTESIAFWEERSQSTCHPVMRARYSDLVWELKKKVTGAKATVTLARQVIDSTLEMADRQLHKYPTEQSGHLGRALALAITIKDSGRAEQIVDAILELHERVGDDDSIGLWTQPFDILLASRAVTLRDDLENQIVDDLEQRLVRFSVPGGTGAPDPFAAEAAAERLATYYARQNKHDEKRRVLKAYGDAFVHMASQASPLVSCSWLQKVLQTYRDNGMREEAAAVSQRIRDIEPHVRDDLKEIRIPGEIDRKKLEEHFEALLAGELAEVLHRLAAWYLPDPERVADELKRIAEVAPIQAMLSVQLKDHAGRTVATLGSLAQDPEGRVAHLAHQDMLMRDLFLGEVVRRLRSRFSPSAIDLLNHLVKAPVFPAVRHGLLLRGLQAFVDEDYVASLCVLVPEVEAALRELLIINNGLVYRPAPKIGGLLHRTMGDLLQDREVELALTHRVTWYLRVLFCDPRGWNLRNDVCHGILSEQMYCAAAANRVLHALLVLAETRLTEVQEDDSVLTVSVEKTSDGGA